MTAPALARDRHSTDPYRDEGLGRAYLDLCFAPSLRLVSRVRRFVTDFYGDVLDDGDLTARTAVATHELLENAVKFTTDDSARIRVSIDDQDGRKRLTVRTWNTATADNIRAVRERFDEIEATADPQEFYRALMLRTSDDVSESGLGFGRVLAEAEMALEHEVHGNTVCIVASVDFDGA